MATSSCENSFSSTGATCACEPASFVVQSAPPTCANGELISTCTTPFANCSKTASALIMSGGSTNSYLSAYCECYSYYLTCLTGTAQCNSAFTAMSMSDCHADFATTEVACSCAPAGSAPAAPALSASCSNTAGVATCLAPFGNCSDEAALVVSGNGDVNTYYQSYCQCYEAFVNCLTVTGECNQAYLAQYTASCERAFAATNATCSCGLQPGATLGVPTTTAVVPASTGNPICQNFLETDTCTTAFQSCSTSASSVVLSLGHDAYLAAYCGCYGTYLQCLNTTAACNDAYVAPYITQCQTQLSSTCACAPGDGTSTALSAAASGPASLTSCSNDAMVSVCTNLFGACATSAVASNGRAAYLNAYCGCFATYLNCFSIAGGCSDDYLSAYTSSCRSAFASQGVMCACSPATTTTTTGALSLTPAPVAFGSVSSSGTTTTTTTAAGLTQPTYVAVTVARQGSALRITMATTALLVVMLAAVC